MSDWINVKDRLPDELFYHSLVTYIDEDGDRMVGIAAYQGDDRWCGVDFWDDDGVITHWMPLPEPPQPQK